MKHKSAFGSALRVGSSALLAIALVACSDGSGPEPVDGTPLPLATLGRGDVAERFTGELWVQGNTAYTTTWSIRTSGTQTTPGNAVKIWDVSGSRPQLADSLIVSNATTLGDVQVTDDGKYMVVATEPVGSIVIYDLANPRKPVQISRFTNANTTKGVHTAEVQTVNGRLYAFLSVDARDGEKSRLTIVDITDPASPAMVFSQVMGTPFVHDVFVRDGILMTALWNDGVAIFDIGGGGKGGTVSTPVQLGTTLTVGGKSHNIFWYRDPQTGSKRYAFVGEENVATFGSMSSGDIHVLDVSDFAHPIEVGFLNVPGAGTHNFSVDEARGILYAAYYNAGVYALNIRGELGACTAAEKSVDGRCDLTKMNRVLGRALGKETIPVFIWGVHYANGKLYASDMLNGLWSISPVP